MKVRNIFAAVALGLAATAVSAEAEAAKMKAIYTVPHEFDMLLKSGHIQGLACSENGIYLSHQSGLAKIGWDGKLVKHIETPRHLGGIACANGRIYGAFIIRDQKDMKDGKPGLLRVWDEDLNQVDEKAFPETAGSVGVLGDTIYYAIGHDKKPHRKCSIKRLGLISATAEIRRSISAMRSSTEYRLSPRTGSLSSARTTAAFRSPTPSSRHSRS